MSKSIFIRICVFTSIALISGMSLFMLTSCGGGGGGSDTTAPTITYVKITQISQTSAIISWDTNENADSEVQYGTTQAYGSQATDDTLEKKHSIQLTGLTAGTTYNFKVLSMDKSDNEVSSGNYTFATQAAGGPAVNIIETVPAAAGGTVTDPDEGTKIEIPAGALASDTAIQVGTDSNASKDANAFGTTIFLGPSGTNFSSPATVTVSYDENDIPSGVDEEDLYLVLSENNGTSWTKLTTTVNTSQNTMTAQLNGFSLVGTAGEPPVVDTTPPVISNISVINITQTSATVTWTTDEAATCVVNYGTTSAYGQVNANTPLVTSHSVTLTGLSADTTYHYQVVSVDAALNSAESDDMTFQTAESTGDTTPPVISNVSVTNIDSNNATFTWSTNEAATSEVGYGLTMIEQYATVEGLRTMHSVQATGLTQNTTYKYIIKSVDAAGNMQITDEGTFTTASGGDTTPPVISNISVTDLGTTYVVIGWTTDEPATSVIEMGTTTEYLGAKPTSLDLVTSHSLGNPMLEPDTTYHYRVSSTDGFGNTSTSGDMTFKTLEQTGGTYSFVSDSGSVSTYNIDNFPDLPDDVPYFSGEGDGKYHMFAVSVQNDGSIDLSTGQQIQVEVIYPNGSTKQQLVYMPEVDDPCTAEDESLLYSGEYYKAVAISSTPPNGTYTFRAYGSAVANEPTVQDDYNGSILNTPTLVAPSSGANTSTVVTFDWDSVPNATGYFVIATPDDADYEECGILIPEGVFSAFVQAPTTESTVTKKLALSKDYFWMISASDATSDNFSASFGDFRTTSEGDLPSPTIQGTVTNERAANLNNVRVGYYVDEFGGTPTAFTIMDSVTVDGSGYYQIDLPEITSGTILADLRLYAWIDENGDGQLEPEDDDAFDFYEDWGEAEDDVYYSSAAGWIADGGPVNAGTTVDIVIDQAGLGGGGGTGGVSYSADIQPLFTLTCNICHGASSPAGGLELTSYTTLMAGGNSGQVVIPNNANGSLLVQKLEDTSDFTHYYMTDATKKQEIREWIGNGALND